MVRCYEIKLDISADVTVGNIPVLTPGTEPCPFHFYQGNVEEPTA